MQNLDRKRLREQTTRDRCSPRAVCGAQFSARTVDFRECHAAIDQQWSMSVTSRDCACIKPAQCSARWRGEWGDRARTTGSLRSQHSSTA
jgi:hypothetical protein